MIKLVLTNLIPDREEQKKHDLKIIEWVCGENDNCITVLELTGILSAEQKLDKKDSKALFKALIDFLEKNKNEVVLIDTSRDHYWRDSFEDSVEGLKILHKPYPEGLFNEKTD